jgi:hypothetical protein
MFTWTLKSKILALDEVLGVVDLAGALGLQHLFADAQALRDLFKISGPPPAGLQCGV